MNYIKIYFEICYNAKNSNREKTDINVYESHHIKPKSLGGSNTESNLVLLTYKEHYIVHFLLYKHYKSVNDTFSSNKMAHAWNAMSLNTHGTRYNSNTFSLAREAMKKALTGRILSKEQKQKISESVKASFNEERKQKQVKALTGQKHSKERNEQKSKYFKDKPQQQVKCPHCGKSGGISNMKRYHFDKCKSQQC